MQLPTLRLGYIHIGHEGNAADSAVIRIGTGGDQTRTFIAGIFGANVLGGALPVEVDRQGDAAGPARDGRTASSY